MGSIGKALLAILIALRVVNINIGNAPDRVKTYIPPQTRTVDTVKIGIIPFENLTDERNASERITQPLMTYLLSSGKFSVVDPAIIQQTMIDMKLRSVLEINLDTGAQMMGKLGVRYLLVGTITSFKTERDGQDAYPVISLNARLLDIKELDIAWAISVSRTGKDKAKIFDLGRVDTLESLAMEVVGEISSALANNVPAIAAELAPANAPFVYRVMPPLLPPRAVSAPSTSLSGAAPASPAPAESRKSKFKDGAELTENDAKSLLSDIGGYEKKEVVYEGEKFFPVVFTRYKKGDAVFLVDVTDYETAEQSARFLGINHPSLSPSVMLGMPFFRAESKYGLLVFDFQAGRFAVRVAGSPETESDLKALSEKILKNFIE